MLFTAIYCTVIPAILLYVLQFTGLPYCAASIYLLSSVVSVYLILSPLAKGHTSYCELVCGPQVEKQQ